ncbi:acetyl-CoA synthetase-like protein [Rhodocollybia butyracea]|uniref:Acetyl-CoA synthetase-like protein n=1 Tax=Rhodocollybia butyracea TaxID=206335 RepID=A0A9P5UD47_9AGAR|nr:acetyl-CoA synthetase-like protein [Rhodocollybia butyracea]
MVFTPKRSVEECNRIITAPGALHELEHRVINGSVQRVYKNLWPSLRVFWLEVCKLHQDKMYIVYENERFTFQQMLEKSVKAAAMLRKSYNVQKGDRVGICSRNYIEYLVVFWGAVRRRRRLTIPLDLIGAVPVMVNAWLPVDTLEFCIIYTDCKVLLLDSERADVLEKSIQRIVKQNSMTGVLVFRTHEGRGSWQGMSSWTEMLRRYEEVNTSAILKEDPGILPEDNAAIYFTSGTTGRPKGVLSTQRQYLTNAFNALIGTMRNTLRKGESLDQPIPDEPQKGFLISVPFFHVTGTTSQALLATLRGIKIVLIRKWSTQEGERRKLIRKENIAIAGGVPAMVNELVDTGGFALDSLNFGGAPSSILLGEKLKSSLPNTILQFHRSQGYGMTETNSIAVSITGVDCEIRPGSTGLPTPVNDLLIMDPETLKEVPVGSVGEVWMKGVNVMQGYWKDEEATTRAMTTDGWLRSGDLGYVDEEGFLFIKDRLKDIIDSVSVENAVYAHPAIQEAGAIGVPDERLGELVAVVASLKPNSGTVSEEEVISVTRKSLPKFAVPVMVILKAEPLEHTPSGKIIKTVLRQLAKETWKQREGHKANKAKL